jgi:hypothetical protein
VSEFIVGVVVDVLRHIGVEDFKSGSVGWISAPAWDFAVLNAPEFVVLYAEVSLQDFRRCREPKQSRISGSKSAAVFFGSLLS